MKMRTWVSFDWAIKKILRHKENFSVLEGFLSELLGFDVFILNLLESESNKQTEQDKYDRVDILVQTVEKELMLIEVQYDDEEDYFHRMVYGISKLITEYIHEGQKYGEIKKAYSINIMYFRIGQGTDYIYEYQGNFVGRKKNDILKPTNYQKKKYKIVNVADIFPKYYVIRVGSFKPEKIVDPIDEWMYFLKNSEIKDDFKAKGMGKAKEVLRYEGMSDQEKQAYQRHVENRRIERAVTDTAKNTGKRESAIEIAKSLLELNLSVELIVKSTKLTMEEVLILQAGGDLSEPED